MRKSLLFSLVLLIFFGLGGCIVVTDRLDYRNDLSDYEVKKIVRKVLLSKQTLAQAALINDEMFYRLSRLDTPPSRYSCERNGYITLQLAEGAISWQLTLGVPLYLNYYECAFQSPWFEENRFSGPVSITYHQYIDDHEAHLSDFTIDFDRAGIYIGATLLRIEGRLGVHLERYYNEGIHKLILSSNRLTIIDSGWEEQILYNIVLDFGTDSYTHRYRYSYSGTLFSDYLGKLTFSTLRPMEGYDNRHPDAGNLQISNNHVRITLRPVDDYYLDIVVENHYRPYENRTIHTTWLNIGL